MGNVNLNLNYNLNFNDNENLNGNDNDDGWNGLMRILVVEVPAETEADAGGVHRVVG